MTAISRNTGCQDHDQPGQGDDVQAVYVLMGNAGYYGLLAANIACIRKVAPTADVLIYDWGDAKGRAAFSHSAPGLQIVDWTKRISDVTALENSTTPHQRVKLALAFNARFARTFRQRLRKAILKRCPGSRLARPLIRAGLTFENMLIQKVPCMLDASRRVGARPMIFLDADAFLVKSLNQAYVGRDFDVAVTMNDRLNWAENQCSVINSGVILFGRRPAEREALLVEWLEAIANCHEWLREQTALTRLLNARAPSLFSPGASTEVKLNGQVVRLLALACAEYNNTDRKTALTAGARVVHLANSAHNLPEVAALLNRIAVS